MTFVIKEKFVEEGDLYDKEFDLEPFSYLFNKGTCFTDSEFVYKDHQMLEFILKNLEVIDPDLLESIHYVQEVGNRVSYQNCGLYLLKLTRMDEVSCCYRLLFGLIKFFAGAYEEDSQIRNSALHLAVQ